MKIYDFSRKSAFFFSTNVLASVVQSDVSLLRAYILFGKHIIQLVVV